MQILSLAGTGFLAQAPLPTGNTADAQAAFREFLERASGEWKVLALWLLAMLLLPIISYWLASKPLTDEGQGTFGRALKVWLLYVVFGTALVVVAGVVVWKYFPPGMATSMASPAKDTVVASIILLVMGLVALIALFAVPMKVYNFGLGSAILFVIMAMIVNGVGSVAFNLAFAAPMKRLAEYGQDLSVRLGSSRDPKLSSIFQSKAVFIRTADSLAKRAGDRSLPLQARQQAIKEFYTELENYRSTLNGENPVGVAAYEKQKARYEQILADLKAEVAGTK